MWKPSQNTVNIPSREHIRSLFPHIWYANHMHSLHHQSLRWRHNGRDSVSNHQPHDCLLNRLFRRRSKKTLKLRVTGLCEGNSPVTDEFPTQMASYAENFPFDDVIMMKKQQQNQPIVTPYDDLYQVTDCCLKAPIRCLSQCWLVKGVFWYSPERHLTRSAHEFHP